MSAATLYRTDHLACRLNEGKLVQVRELVVRMRKVAEREAKLQWQKFYLGRWQSFESMAKEGWSRPWAASGELSTTFSQYMMAQVAGSLQGYFGNVQNSYTELVSGSSLPPNIRHQLYFINRRQAWFWKCEVSLKQMVEVTDAKGKTRVKEKPVTVSPEVRALARTLIRKALSLHRKPHFKRFQPQLDQRMCFIQSAHTASHPLWLSVATLEKGKRLSLPLDAHPAFLLRNEKAQVFHALGKTPHPCVSQFPLLAPNQKEARNPHPSAYFLPNTVRLLLSEGQDKLTVSVVTDMSFAFEHQKALYQPLRESVTLDLGLATLFATSDGELYGRGWMETLLRFDKLLTGIARHRQRLGLPTASERYRYHVGKLRGWLKTEVNRILNLLVEKKRPALFIIEKLDFFRSPQLSRRLNRLVSNFGRGLIMKKLAELEKQYGIVTEECQAAYSSQECVSCGYVDKRNRVSQAKFSCRFCGQTCQADIHAARVLSCRRSAAVSPLGKLGVRTTLATLISQFSERFPRPRGGPADPRFSNPYFKDWAKVRSPEAAMLPSLASALA